MKRLSILGLLTLAIAACAPTATQAPASSSPAVWYAGQWTTQNAVLHLVPAQNGDVGLLVRTSQQCAANLKLVSQQSNMLVVRQDVQYGGAACQNGQVLVLRQTGNTVTINLDDDQDPQPLTRTPGAGSKLLKGGIYSGVAVQRNPAASYAVQVVLSQDTTGTVASLIYPEQGCAANLRFVRDEGQAGRYLEEVRHGTCITGGTVRLDLQENTNTLHYRWSKDQVPATVEAFLRPGPLPKK